MKKTALVLIIFLLFSAFAFARDQVEAYGNYVPFSMFFHNIGWNFLHSVTFNYGLNFIGAGVGTVLMIHTGLDWQWNRLAYNNEWMPRTGYFANITGYAVPVALPVAVYLSGIFRKDPKLQITGMALTQALAITAVYQTALKIITAREWPGITNGWDSPSSKRSTRTDDYSDEFHWFSLDTIGGWPSGHTAHAFAAAAVLSQIYRDKIALKVIAYSYASVMGLLMSIYDHWASDVVAGALIGYAIGATVGRSYRNAIEGRESRVTFYATGNSAGVIIKI